MSKIVKSLFDFIFNGWSSIVIVSIIYGFLLGGVAYLVLGIPSGITVGIIAFLYGLKKGPELKKRQDQNRKKIKEIIEKELKSNQRKDYAVEAETHIDNPLPKIKKENDQKKGELITQTLTDDIQKKPVPTKQKISINEANYLLDGYEPFEVKEGSAGKVFICKTDHFKEDNYVAVKVLLGLKSFELKKIKDWLYECHSWVMLGQHPNIVQIKLIHYGIHSPQIVMEYVENNMEDVKNDITGDVLKIIDIGINVCDALIHAKSKIPNFVHQDLKPQNILISSDLQAKVTDFGIMHSDEKSSQLEGLEFTTPNFPRDKMRQQVNIHSETRPGTPPYMSPEQFNKSEPIDSRSDIYSLGCILYELLSGKKVFTASSKSEYQKCHLYNDPPLIKNIDNKIPPELITLIFKCLAKRKERRFKSFSLLRNELAAIKIRYFNQESPPFIASPPNEDAIISIVENLIKIGDYEVARSYSKLITKKLLWKYFFPAHCDSLEKNYSEAITKFKTCLKYVKTDFEKFNVYKELGFAIEKTGDLNQALHYFELCAKIHPHMGVSFADIARVYKKNGMNKEAIKSYKHSLDLAYDPGVVSRYVEFLIDIKHFDDAISELQKALLLFTDDLQLHIHLAMAAIGKLLEDFSNNKYVLEEIEKNLSIAKNHAQLALENGYQIDKAEDILKLYREIKSKVFRTSKTSDKPAFKPNTVSAITLNRKKLNKLKKAVEKFIFLTRYNRHKELTDLIYPRMFYEIVRISKLPIEYYKEEFVKIFLYKNDTGIIIKDMKVVKMNNSIYRCNDRIYTSFLYLTTAIKNSNIIEKLSLTIFISEDEGDSWYFTTFSELAYKFLINELPENNIDALTELNQFHSV